MKKTELIKAFEEAIELDAPYIAVYVQLPLMNEPEAIVNSASNMQEKLEYYKMMYDDELHLNSFNAIRIVDVQYGEFHFTKD